MAEILGAATILRNALPTGVDGSRVAAWQMQNGITYQEFVARLSAALGNLNQEMVNDWGHLFSISEDLMMEYPDGSTVTELPEISDTTTADGVHGSTIGHMVDLKVYGRAIGGSRRFFRDARDAQIRSDIQTIVNQAKWRFERKLLTRFMTTTENVVGSAGYDVPFVAGGGSVAYVPPAYAGKSFTSSHNHYIGYASASKSFADVFNGLADTLAEHGHVAPFTAEVSMTDVETIAALTKYVQMVAPVVTTIQRGGETSGNQLFAQGTPMTVGGVMGYFQSKHGVVELRAKYRLPTGYVGMYKSYGRLDARNPLVVRVHPKEGFGMRIMTETSSDNQYPIKSVALEFEFGVGVGADRTNGAAGYLVSGGAWANPTIS